ncbi:epigen [Cyprinodon tularosa]|uniref:Epigen-like n=1 Tax=Cyprinodon variegatus TaxID=28743 RepID=A0A3Q2CXF3_CYPVA|nr:PREDICTED: epigen-like [Cyprinodon variegatus]XP_038133249.1 epigen [Cyprinodon tularosa]
MSTQRQTYLEKAFSFTVTVLLLLATTGFSEVLDESTMTTESPLPQNSSTTEQVVKRSLGHSTVMHLVRPCGEKNANFCLNGGKCIHPQDSNSPHCNCAPLYYGLRCEKIKLSPSVKDPDIEKKIAIIFGLIVVFIVLALAIFCFVKRRCEHSAPLIKAAASETSV